MGSSPKDTGELLGGLDPRDALMMKEFVESLKAMRAIFPGISRQDF